MIGDVAMLEEIAEEMHKVFFKVKSIDGHEPEGSRRY